MKNNRLSDPQIADDQLALADLNPELIEFIWNDARQSPNLTCYVAQAEDTFSNYGGKSNARCIILALPDVSAATAMRHLHFEGPALLARRDGSVSVNLNKGRIDFPEQVAKYVIDASPSAQLLLMAEDFVGKYRIMCTTANNLPPANEMRLVDAYRSPTTLSADSWNSTEDLVITVNGIARVTPDCGPDDDVEVIPF